jgi:hypothetical protein
MKKITRSKSNCLVSYNPDKETFIREHGLYGRPEHDDYYQNHFDNAKTTVRALEDLWAGGGPLHLLCLAQTQAGKTSVLKCIADTGCRDMTKQEILMVSGDNQKAAKDQNEQVLKDFINVYSAAKFLNAVEAGRMATEGFKLVIIDEGQMSQNVNSRIGKILGKLYMDNPNLIVLVVTATPGGYSNKTSYEGYSSKEISLVMWKEGKGYRGIPDFLENGQIKDISTCYAEQGDFHGKLNPYFFSTVSKNGAVVEELKNNLKEQIDRLAKRETAGVGMIRYENPKQAKLLIEAYCKAKGYKIEIITGHSNPDKRIGDLHNKEAVTALYNTVIIRRKTAITIYDQNYRAGNDLNYSIPKEVKEKMKDRVMFVYEPSDPNFNTHCQGGPGRVCGYHNNTDVIIYGNIHLLQLYTDFYRGRIKLSELDEILRDEPIERVKGGGVISPATSVRKKKTANIRSKHATWMDALPLTGNLVDDVMVYKDKIMSLGFDPYKIREMVATYKQNNVFGSGNVNINGLNKRGEKKHYVNGKAWSNYNDKTKIEPDIALALNTGRINRERIYTDKKRQDKVTIGFLLDDSTNQPVLYLCLLNGEIEIREYKADLIDSTYYNRPEIAEHLFLN